MAVNNIENISKIGSIGKIAGIDNSQNQVQNKGIGDFINIFQQSIKETSGLVDESSKLKDDFVAGINDNLHMVSIAGQKAEIALQLTMQIRNKILDAYSEIMRMQI